MREARAEQKGKGDIETERGEIERRGRGDRGETRVLAKDRM